MTNHWQTPLGLATRHDKARRRAETLRRQADELDEKADRLAREYDEAMSKFFADLKPEQEETPA